MQKVQPIKRPGPGDEALITVGMTLFGFEEGDIPNKYCCVINPYQKVEIVTTPKLWTKPETKQKLKVIGINVPDTRGKKRLFAVAYVLLLFAANTNR